MPAKPSVNKCGDTNSMVNRHIGTAYDNVKIVAAHIAEIIEVSDNIGAVSLYLGAFSVPPTTGWNGEPLVSGNFYLNTTENTVDYYDADEMIWIAVDAQTVVQAAQTAVAARDAALLAQAAAELAETNAESSAAASLASEQASALSEANSASSEAAAANSAVVAAGYATDAEAAFDNFTDRYLGAYPVDPTLDNDGQPLIVGASYWNTTTNDLRFWNGATWDVPEQTASQAAQDALAYRDDAQLSETNAANSAAAAVLSEGNALASENAAAQSAMNAAASAVSAAQSEANIDVAVTEAQNDIVGGSIFKGSNGEYVQNGDTVPLGTTHLRVLVGGTPTILVAWDTLTLPAVVTNVPNAENSFSGYDIVTDQGTFEFVKLKTKDLRSGGFVSGWGAKQITECTLQIQACIDYSSENNITTYIDSHYYIDPTRSTVGNDLSTVHIHGLITRDDTEITFLPGAVLESIPTSVERYCVLLIESDGAIINNPVIIGDVDTHVGTTGEWGYGIRYDFNSKNCIVNNPKVTKCWGDSFVVVSDYGNNSLINPYGAYSRRQGLSIIRTGPGGLNVHNYHFEFIGGTLPQAGIDFEPDNATEQLIVTLSGGGRCNDNVGYDLDFFFAKQSSASKAHEISFTGVHEIQQWIRFNSVANINVKNSIKFDTLKLGVNPSIGYIVHEASNGCDSIDIGTLICDRPPLVNLLPREEAEVKNFGRITVDNLIINDESEYIRGITLSNPGELPKYKWTRPDLISFKNVVTSDSYNMQAISLPDATRLPVRYENVKCFTEIAGTTFTLELKNYQAKDIILTRTANTSFNVPVDAFSLGTVKTITGKEAGFTTRLSPVDCKINGKTDQITFVHPFKIELRVDESSDNIGDSYIYNLIYGEIQAV